MTMSKLGQFCIGKEKRVYALGEYIPRNDQIIQVAKFAEVP
jgi:hypothetical protein